MIHRRTVIAAVMAIMALGCALSAVAQDVADKEVPAEKTAEQLAMEEAEKAGQQAQKLYEAGKVEEAVDLLWRTAGALPPGRPAEELRNYALMIRLQKFLEDGKNLGGRREDDSRSNGTPHHCAEGMGADGRRLAVRHGGEL